MQRVGQWTIVLVFLACCGVMGMISRGLHFRSIRSPVWSLLLFHR